jgi:hypothetical protein
MAALHFANGIGNRMAGRLPLRRTSNGLAPPLQTNGAELRLARLLGDAGELDIKGRNSKKIGPQRSRRKQSGKSAVGVA